MVADVAGISGRAAEMTNKSGNAADVPLAGQTLTGWTCVTDVNATGVFQIIRRHAIGVLQAGSESRLDGRRSRGERRA